MYLKITKAIYDKLNIILNGEKLKSFPVKSGTKQRYLVLVLQFLAKAIGKRRKGDTNRKEKRPNYPYSQMTSSCN
jgi:hypothetical protein